MPGRSVTGTSRLGYRDSLRALSTAGKATSRGAPAYSRFVNRRLGRLLAAGAHTLGMSPDAVTAVSAVFTFTGIILLALVPPSWTLGVVIWLLLALGYALDSADGQVSRLTGRSSVAGEWLDHVVDSVKVVTLPLALLVGLYRFGDVRPVVLLVPLLHAAAQSVHFFAMILTGKLRSQENVERVAAVSGGTYVRTLVALPTDYGLLCFVFVLLGALPAFLWVYGIIVAYTTLFVAGVLVKWYREMRRLARPHGPARTPGAEQA